LVQYPYFATQEVRSIAQDEKDGIRFLYDSANSNFHPASQEPWGAQGGLNDDRSKFIGYTGQGWVFGTTLWSNFPTIQWQQSKRWALLQGPHTINVVVTHRKNVAAADYYVDVDKFVPD